MGMTFSTIQIQNRAGLKAAQFKKELMAHMKAKGFKPVPEEEAEVSYIFALSKNKAWFTLVCPDYEPVTEPVLKDAKELAVTFKTNCIITSAVDSDMVFLDCFNEKGEKTEKVSLGVADFIGGDEGDIPDECKQDANSANPDFWKGMLTEGYTFEQLKEVWNGDYTFQEEALMNMAPLLGMDSDKLNADYQICEEEAPPGTAAVHFAKAGAKTKSLNTVFKEVFGEALQPLGFVKIKGKQPYFVRVVEGGEIIHVVTYSPDKTYIKGVNAFKILGGVATVYRPRINLKTPFVDNWLKDILRFYHAAGENLGDDFVKSVREFRYNAGDDEAMIETLVRALNATERFLLPVFDKTADLKACIEFFHLFNSEQMRLYSKDENFTAGEFESSQYNEGLLYFKIDYYKSFEKKVENSIASSAHAMKKRIGTEKHNITQERYEEYCKDVAQRLYGQLSLLKSFYDDPVLNAKVTAELERRKAANTEILRSYGLKL